MGNLETENRMVAVCDILGFKDLVLSRDVSNLLEGEFSIFRKLVGFSVNKDEVSSIPPELAELRKQDNVGFAWFSDTVIIYSISDDDLSCRNVIETAGRLLFTTMHTNTRVRVGISYGHFHADQVNEIYLGQALVEAYQLEQAQQWSGGALTSSAAKRLPQRTTSGERFQWWVCEYPVPLNKERKADCSNLAIDWTQGIHQRLDLKWSTQSETPSQKEQEVIPSVCQKWENTIRFHREVCTTCFPGNRSLDPLKQT